MSAGENIIRIDGPDKVRGRTRFVADLRVPGMLDGVIVRSPVAAGAIRGLRLNPAFDWTQVAVVTPADIPGLNVVQMIAADMPCLAEHEVNYLGEPVALVAAPDLALARAAAANITLEIDPRPPLCGIENIVARFQKAPGELTLLSDYLLEKGSVEQGFREADLVVEGEYCTSAQEHAYLEPQGILAFLETGGVMRITGSLQCPYYIRPAVAKVLGVPDEQVIVEQAPTGGAFGGKEDFPSTIAAQAALLARQSGRPVRILFDRVEDISFSTKRHAAWLQHKTGVKKDGTLTAIAGQIIFDGGAYTTLSPVVLSRGLLHACSVYRCPNVRLAAYAVRSNMPPAGAFRGFGAPQTIFGMEAQMDEIAARLNLSPLAVRRRNVVRQGDATATGQVLTESVSAEKCLETVAANCRYDLRRGACDTDNQRPAGLVKRGLGLAAFLHGASFTGSGEKYLAARAALRLHGDGRVDILASTTDIGQGAFTVFSQIAAAALGLPLGLIRFPMPNTARAPNSGPTVASRSTMIVGRILELCAQELISRVAGALGHGAVRDGSGFRLGSGRAVSWAAAAHVVAGQEPLTIEKEYDFPATQVWDDATFKGSAYPVYAWGAAAVELEVNLRTCEPAVKEIWLVYEVGKAVNPLAVRGQLEGGSLQSLGWGLLEQLDIVDARYLQNRLQTYIIPTAADLPEVHLSVLEQPYSRGPAGGAKGIGELPMNGVAAAIRNAVRHALGVSLNSLPLTPEKIFAALRGKDAR